MMMIVSVMTIAMVRVTVVVMVIMMMMRVVVIMMMMRVMVIMMMVVIRMTTVYIVRDSYKDKATIFLLKHPFTPCAIARYHY